MYFVEKILIILLVLMVAFLVVAPIWAIAGNIQKCEQYNETDIPHQWKLSYGCRVMLPNGYWTNADEASQFYYLEVNQD